MRRVPRWLIVILGALITLIKALLRQRIHQGARLQMKIEGENTLSTQVDLGTVQKLRLGAAFTVAIVILAADGTPDTKANVNVTGFAVRDVKDADGNAVDSSRFATITTVDNKDYTVQMSKDTNDLGVTGTFGAEGDVTWPDDESGAIPPKHLGEVGTATLSDDPTAKDRLEMVATF